jgi:hypothetical protein
MSEDRAPVPTRAFSFVIAAAFAVVVWRATALVLVYSRGEDPLLIKALLALVGMTFLVCGLLVFWKTPSKASLLFVGFCLCSGLHWGGPLELPPGQLRTGLILLYVLVSGFLGETFLLHLALSFPKVARIAGGKSFIRFLYAPVILATVLAAIYVVSPSETTQGSFFLLHAVVSNLFGVLALAIFVSHILRAGLTGMQKRYVALMVAGMLTAWVPDLVASAVGVDTEPWTLTFVALPVSFAIAFFGIEKAQGPA